MRSQVNHDVAHGLINGQWPVNSVDLCRVLNIHHDDIEQAVPFLTFEADYVRVPDQRRLWLTCEAAVKVAVFLGGGRAAYDVADWLGQSGRDDGRLAAANG